MGSGCSCQKSTTYEAKNFDFESPEQWIAIKDMTIEMKYDETSFSGTDCIVLRLNDNQTTQQPLFKIEGSLTGDTIKISDINNKVIARIDCCTERFIIENVEHQRIANVVRAKSNFYVTSPEDTENEIYFKINGKFNKWKRWNIDDRVRTSLHPQSHHNYSIKIAKNMNYLMVVLIAVSIDEQIRHQKARKRKK